MFTGRLAVPCSSVGAPPFASLLIASRSFQRGMWRADRCLQTAGILDVISYSTQSVEQVVSSGWDEYAVIEARFDEELWTAAWLRAECYFEDRSHDRFVQSYKRMFSEQEFTALKRRCSGQYGNCLRCTCLLVVSDYEDERTALLHRVMGTLDVSIRQALPGHAADEIASLKSGTRRYCYIANVCVSRHHRRKGVATRLLDSAIQTAKSWGFDLVYVHVNSLNKAARLLYHRRGFRLAQKQTPDDDSVLLLSLSIT